jgi:serine phosphatase RsbU (regulator of sigma subunit)/anti-sigma regulatory factor (Ser/Thr protein kinase)
MTSIQQILHGIFNRRSPRQSGEVTGASSLLPTSAILPEFDIHPEDPLLEYFKTSPSATLIDKIEFDSPALNQMKTAGIKLIVPLVSQGDVIGLLNLGQRLSEQEYSSDDIILLNNLAAQATPAVRVAQLVREQQIEAQERERLEQEMRVARLIQQTLLPKELPRPKGWNIDAYYQPARAVGGDFYDFINLPDGRLGVFVGDVTDKGVPAALVMATTRSILRFAAEKEGSPGTVLERANELLVADIPPNMFVTCLYLILDTISGAIVYANAGHNPPYCCGKDNIVELRATGMPLGLMPEMKYEEKQAVLSEGQCVLFYSDGLTEAHNPQGEIYGFGRVRGMMKQTGNGSSFITQILHDLNHFTTPHWEQEDDVTLVTLHREVNNDPTTSSRKLISSFELASQAGNERIAMEKVAGLAKDLGFSKQRLDRLKTAVAEATMNAIEHGNHYRADLPVDIEVQVSDEDFIVIIRDHGGDKSILPTTQPDLEAKLEGTQSPRGWGLFLIEKMVDEMNVTHDQDHHIIELVFHREEGK